MNLISKMKILINIVKTHGKQLSRPEFFDYYGVELAMEDDRCHILLPFILNVSIDGKESLKFLVGDEHIFNCLFDKLSPIADI